MERRIDLKIILLQKLKSMNIYERKLKWKLLLLFSAVVIAIGSLYYTNQLVNKLEVEERKKVELWAEATRQLVREETHDYDFLLHIIQSNTTIPLILTDSNDTIISHRNLDSVKVLQKGYLEQQLKLMKSKQEPIVINIGKNKKNFIYYRESHLLLQLKYYPYFQLAIILLFILIAYFAFSASRNAEQNKVWVGLTKETAHQLGTPTSSLLAWAELIKSKYNDIKFAEEFEKDVKRLEIITDRFSKIGSVPKLISTPLAEVIESSISYLRSRSSQKIDFIIDIQSPLISVPLSRNLFEWVIENLCKNAIDAISDKGTIRITLKEQNKKVYIDVTDNGKGIPKSKHKTVFKPGYTTKTRGWGLGLSLAKRIVENYHSGKIFVLQSEPGKGTTFRIVLKNAS
jgi:signal transduction histidine kinase